MAKGGALRTYVCLRCQSRLYSNNATRPFPYIRTLYTSTRQASAPAPTSTESLSRNHANKDSILIKYAESFDPIEARSKRVSAPLDLESLGGPGEVLVLRDVDARRGYRYAAVKKPDNVGSSASADDIFASIDADRSAPGQEEVNRHIDTMKPAKTSDDQPAALTKEEFNRKFDQLYEQFNFDQLSKYYNITNGVQILESREAPAPSAPTRFRKSNWQPLSSDLNPSKMSIPNAYSSSGRKAKIVYKILASLWKVQLAEQLDQVGEVELRADRRSMTLLLVGGKSSVLGRIGTEASAKIEVFRSEGLIKITAPKAACSKVVDQINRLFDDYHESTFDLRFTRLKKSWAKPPSAQALLALSRSAHTSIEVSSDSKTLTMRSLNATDAQHANRMLRALITKPTRTIQQLVFGEELNSRPVMYAPVGETDSLPFKHRHEPHGRIVRPAEMIKMVKPAPRTTEKIRASESAAAVADNLREFLQRSNPLVDAEDNSQPALSIPERTLGWQTTPWTVLRCSFGKILHPIEANWTEPISQQKLEQLGSRSDNQYEFDRLAPLGSQMVNSIRLPSTVSESNAGTLVDAQGRSKETFCVSMVPQIANGSQQPSKHPELELSLTVDRENQSVEVDSLAAILHTKEMGVMFPSLSSDVEFSKSVRVFNAEPATQPAVAAFLREIQNHLAGFGRIQTPPTVSIQIPKAPAGEASAAGDEHGDGTVRVEYVVSELQYNQVMSYSYGDFELAWCHREGGDVGGRREELWIQTGHGIAAPSQRGALTSAARVQQTPEVPDVDAFVQHTLKLLDQIQTLANQLVAIPDPPTAQAPLHTARLTKRSTRP